MCLHIHFLHFVDDFPFGFSSSLQFQQMLLLVLLLLLLLLVGWFRRMENGCACLFAISVDSIHCVQYVRVLIESESESRSTPLRLYRHNGKCSATNTHKTPYTSNTFISTINTHANKTATTARTAQYIHGKKAMCDTKSGSWKEKREATEQVNTRTREKHIHESQSMPRVDFLIFPVKGYLSDWNVYFIHKENHHFSRSVRFSVAFLFSFSLNKSDPNTPH